MINIMGKEYLTVKEASKRYGMSPEWFAKRRFQKLAPKYAQLEDKAKILYPVIETDQWFEHRLRIKEGA